MVCISSKSFEKHLLVIWCLLLTLRIWSWLRFVSLQCRHYSSLLLVCGQHVDKLDQQNNAEEKVKRSPQTVKCCERESAGRFFYSLFFSKFCPCWLPLIITNHNVHGLSLAAQWTEAEYSTPEHRGKPNLLVFKIMLAVWSSLHLIFVVA